MQCVDDKGPGEGDHGPDGKDGDEEDEIERKVASRRSVEGLRERRDEFLCGHRPGWSSAVHLGCGSSRNEWTSLDKGKSCRSEREETEARARTVGWQSKQSRARTMRHCPHLFFTRAGHARLRVYIRSPRCPSREMRDLE